MDKRELLRKWGPRVVVLGLIWAAVAVWRPGIIGGFTHSPRAIALIIAGLAFAIGLEWVIRRKGWHKWATAAFYAVIIVGVLGAVIPSFIDKSVHEAESEVFRDATAGRPLEPGGPATSPPMPMMDTGPVELGEAEVEGIDHRASGTVRVVRDGDGQLHVRFEGLDVEPGPDYFIWLVPGTDRDNTDNGANLGHIKANKGDQEYQAPDDFRAEQPLTVLIWCRAFAVPVGNATIA